MKSTMNHQQGVDATEGYAGDGEGDTPLRQESGDETSNQPVAGRPDELEFLHLLLAHRVAPDNQLRTKMLAKRIDQAIRFAVRSGQVEVKAGAKKGKLGKVATLKPYADELHSRTWDRLLSQQQKDGQLLAQYDPQAKPKRTVYSWIWQNYNYAALDQLEKHNSTHEAGKQFEVSLEEIESSGDALDESGKRSELPEQLGVSTTPLRASHLRVRKLVPWVAKLAAEMVGKTQTLTYVTGTQTVTSQIQFDLSHQDIWMKYLAMNQVSQDGLNLECSVDELNDISEAALAEQMGIPKKRIQDRSNEAFAFMLAHPQLPEYLALMIPNSFRAKGLGEQVLRERTMAGLKAPGGKSMFRECVHIWLETHYS